MHGPCFAARLQMPLRMQVSYFFDPECFTSDGFKYGPSSVYYGYRHPMKPHRITMTHSLLMNSPFWPSLQVRRTSAGARTDTSDAQC